MSALKAELAFISYLQKDAAAKVTRKGELWLGYKSYKLRNDLNLFIFSFGRPLVGQNYQFWHILPDKEPSEGGKQYIEIISEPVWTSQDLFPPFE